MNGKSLQSQMQIGQLSLSTMYQLLRNQQFAAAI
jgi:hypothetical protein